MHSSKVDAQITTDTGFQDSLVVQGFREGGGSDAYVFLGALPELVGSPMGIDIVLTPENANILGEELRKHAEFALTVRETENND